MVELWVPCWLSTKVGRLVVDTEKANEKFRGQVIQEILDLDDTDVPVPEHLVSQESKAM